MLSLVRSLFFLALPVIALANNVHDSSIADVKKRTFTETSCNNWADCEADGLNLSCQLDYKDPYAPIIFDRPANETYTLACGFKIAPAPDAFLHVMVDSPLITMPDNIFLLDGRTLSRSS